MLPYSHYFPFRDGTRPVTVNSPRDSPVSVPVGTYEGLSDRARSMGHYPFSTTTTTATPPVPPFPSPPSTPTDRYREPPSPQPPGRSTHTFGEGTCYPGCKSDLHSTGTSEIPLSSPLCGLLRDLPFEEIVDLAYMFNYNDDER